jgi:hypothetical protein
MQVIANDLYRGVSPNADLIYKSVTGLVGKARSWELSCVCVKQEGCPCDDLLAWVRDHFPSDSNPEELFPRQSFPDRRPEPGTLETLVRSRLGLRESDGFLQTYHELRRLIDIGRIRSGRADIIQRDVLSLEERVMNSRLEEEVRRPLLIASAVARHSMYLGLASGHQVERAPEWVGDDVDGATVGAIAGGLAGPVGAAKGGLIGATIFSIATATGWW